MNDAVVSLDQIERAEARQKAKSRAGERFRVEMFDEIDIGAEPEWLVKDILPRTGLALVIGEPGCGKSFMCSDLGMAIATGRTWAGKSAQAGAVVYVTPEGVSGFRKRLVAYRQHHRPPPGVPLFLITDAADLGHAPGDAAQLAHRIEDQVETVAVVFVDTLARSMGGADENSTGDMSVLVENCARIAKALDCLVVLVHHLGKDAARGARGSSVLKAAADIEITVTGSEGERSARITKSKDGESGLEMTFSLDRVELGGTMSSCIVSIQSEWSFAAAEKSAPKVTGSALIALNALQLAIDEAGETPPTTGRSKRTKRAVRSSLWRKYADMVLITETNSADSKRMAFKRASERLQNIGKVGVWDDWCWIED